MMEEASRRLDSIRRRWGEGLREEDDLLEWDAKVMATWVSSEWTTRKGRLLVEEDLQEEEEEEERRWAE